MVRSPGRCRAALFVFALRAPFQAAEKLKFIDREEVEGIAPVSLADA